MKTNLFKNILNKSRNENLYLSIYTNKENTNTFSMGIACNHDDDFILLKKVSPEGNYDGFSIILLEDVYCVEFEDIYLKKVQLVIKEDIIKLQSDVQAHLSNNFRFDDAIDLFIKQQYLVSIDLIYDRGFIGYIKEFDGENIIINNVDDNHNSEGFSIFKVSEIEKINLFSTELRAIANLK